MQAQVEIAPMSMHIIERVRAMTKAKAKLGQEFPQAPPRRVRICEVDR